MIAYPTRLGSEIYVFSEAKIHPTVVIGHGSVVGFPTIELPYPPDEILGREISDDVRIGCFCVIEAGAFLHNKVILDHYVRVGPGTTIGDGTRLLYGTRVHCDVTIGKRCLISGKCPDRSVIGDDVRHFGRLHHDYFAPSATWNDLEEPSAVIGARSVIGAGATVVGGVKIGCNVYVAVGETVHTDVPDRSIVYKGNIIPGREWRGRLRDSGFFEWEGGQ